jgi:hypothetical protein
MRIHNVYEDANGESDFTPSYRDVENLLAERGLRCPRPLGSQSETAREIIRSLRRETNEGDLSLFLDGCHWRDAICFRIASRITSIARSRGRELE